MTKSQLARLYRDYIACLNAQDWQALGRYVDAAVVRNGEKLGLAGYRAMLENDFAAIPDLRFDIELLVVDPPYLASRLRFNCTPRGRLMGLDTGGLKLSFTENVFYEVAADRIARVWSVIDKAAIEAQLPPDRGG